MPRTPVSQHLASLLGALAFFLVACTFLAACTGPSPFVRAGNANSVEISYSGDVDAALSLARQHCAQFEKVPRLIDTGPNVAVFNCVGR
jgi:hypothetical protein